MSSQQQIIERIQKLEALALSEKQIGNFQASKAAQDKANLLKQKYSISTATVNSFTSSSTVNNKDNSLYRFRKTVTFSYEIKKTVVNYIQLAAKYSNCDFEEFKIEVIEKKFFIFPSRIRLSFNLVGKYDNLKTFRNTFYELFTFSK